VSSDYPKASLIKKICKKKREEAPHFTPRESKSTACHFRGLTEGHGDSRDVMVMKEEEERLQRVRSD